MSRHPPDAPRGTWQRERSAGAQSSAQGGHGSRGLLPQHHLTDALSPWSLRGPLGGRLVRGAGLRRVGSTVVGLIIAETDERRWAFVVITLLDWGSSTTFFSST